MHSAASLAYFKDKRGIKGSVSQCFDLWVCFMMHFRELLADLLPLFVS